MLRSLKDLEGYGVGAEDGNVGRVQDFLFDDERWAVRYMVADPQHHQRPVLLSPVSFRQVDWSTHRFDVALTKAKIKQSPDVDLQKPVSRQHEMQLSSYYGYPNYWGFSGVWGMHGAALLSPIPLDEPRSSPSEGSGDVHLRSASEVRGYHVEGTDKSVGHIKDFIVDDESWELRYLVVDTSNWGFGKNVLVAPQWTTRIDWVERRIHIGLDRQVIKSGPEWDENAPINREYEVRLYDYYGRPSYWEGAKYLAPAKAGEHPTSAPAL